VSCCWMWVGKDCGLSREEEEEGCPTRKWTAQDQDDLADHLKHQKPGEENPLDEPLKFGKRALQVLNPAEDKLEPEAAGC